MLTINVSELILSIINFFLLFFLLKHFLYTPLVSFMDSRKAKIEAGLNEEKQALAASEEQRQQLEQQRSESLQEAKRIVDESRSADERRHAESVAKAREQALQERKTAKETAEAESEAGKQQLDADCRRLAGVLAERLLH